MSKLIVDTLESTDGLSSATIANINVATDVSAQVDTNTSNIAINTADIAALPAYSETTVELNGDYTAGSFIKCAKIGKIVVITAEGSLSHASGEFASSLDGVIPVAYRPSSNINNMYLVSLGTIFKVLVTSGGLFSTTYFISDLSTGSTKTSTGLGVSISYISA